MKRKKWIGYSLGIALLLAFAASAQAQETNAPKPAATTQELTAAPQEANFTVTGKFTAQRRPRVTVFEFENTNTEARNSRYGSSVEAMLVTFLKRKSQFVVVDRHDSTLKRLLEEKKRAQHGQTQSRPGDTSDRALLEKLDAYILGSVTLLTVNETTPSSSKPTVSDSADATPQTREEIRQQITGPRIEIDAKLLSRFDGRIIAAAQRRGPVACLRSIVERLGIALEQEFLRPYYGKLRVNLKEPENARFFLTPILLDNALDEEKPPVEHSASVRIGKEFDKVVPWSTDPTTYTIDSLLSGWYSLRLERPGYEGTGVENARWVVKNFFGELEVYDSVTKKRWNPADSGEGRFVVHVDPLKTEPLNGDPEGRNFVLRRLSGSLKPLVKRQYLDKDFSQAPRRAVLMGGLKIELNHVEKPEQYSDDPKCGYFDEQLPHTSDFGRTYVASGEMFDFDKFKGGELIIEDYKGETIPVGAYQMAFWEPYYNRPEVEVTVQDRDQAKPAKTTLVRETLSLEMEATGPRPASHGILEGHDTHHRVEFPLDFRRPKEQASLPVDTYIASTNISGLDGWERGFELLPPSKLAPVFDTSSEKNKLKLIPPADAKPVLPPPPLLKVKTRLGLGGRLSVFSRPPDPLAADVYIDHDLLKIVNLLLYGQEERPDELQQRGFFYSLFHFFSPSPKGGSETKSPNLANAAPLLLFPHDPDALRKLLAQHLEVIDLLVLDPRDMAQLRQSREVSAIVQRYVETGGALFGFVSETGDYQNVIGAPLSLESKSHKTKLFEITQGDVKGIVPSFEKRVKVKSRRALPEVGKFAPGNSWRVIAFTQGRTYPRLIERGKREAGGYVALWLDDPASYYGPLGGTVAEVEETRQKVEERVLDWAHFLMYRRYDKSGERARPAAAALLR